DLVRVIAFETPGAAMFTSMALENDEESDAVDVQDACHIVLIWFEENGLEQDERDEMTNLIEESVSCYGATLSTTVPLVRGLAREGCNRRIHPPGPCSRALQAYHGKTSSARLPRRPRVSLWPGPV